MSTTPRVETDDKMSESNIDTEDAYISSPNSTPPPPTFDDIDRWRYHTDLRKFGESLEKAANAVFPNDRKSRYSHVSVLMLSWADEDPMLPVSREIDELHRVFRDVYHFETDRWTIPDLDSHFKVTKKVMDFVKPTPDNKSKLKIVYYAGHARLMSTRGLAWTRYATMA
jgi:hypothetical protein